MIIYIYYIYNLYDPCLNFAKTPSLCCWPCLRNVVKFCSPTVDDCRSWNLQCLPTISVRYIRYCSHVHSIWTLKILKQLYSQELGRLKWRLKRSVLEHVCQTLQAPTITLSSQGIATASKRAPWKKAVVRTIVSPSSVGKLWNLSSRPFFLWSFESFDIMETYGNQDFT